MCKVERGVSHLGDISFFVLEKSSAGNPIAISMQKNLTIIPLHFG